MWKVRNRSTRLYSVPVCKNDGSNTAVIFCVPKYMYDILQQLLTNETKCIIINLKVNNLKVNYNIEVILCL